MKVRRFPPTADGSHTIGETFEVHWWQPLWWRLQWLRVTLWRQGHIEWRLR